MTQQVSFKARWRHIVEDTRRRLAARDLLLGVFVAFHDRRLMDFWAAAGFSYVIIDMEHATIGLAEADQLIEAAVNCGLAPLVRAAPQDRQALLRCLDAGAAGIVVPDVQSADEVESWVEAISYPPTGMRGLAQVRVNDWNSADTTDDQRWRPLLVPMIESLAAIEQADALFSIAAADWYHVGLVDLGMRLRADPSAPKPMDLLQQLCQLGLEKGAVLGCNQMTSPAVAAPPAGVGAVAIPDRALVTYGAQFFANGTAA